MAIGRPVRLCILLGWALLASCTRGGFFPGEASLGPRDRAGLEPRDSSPDALQSELGALDRGPAEARSFTPAAMLGLGIWLAADRIVGVADGAPVSSWADLSGKGHNFGKWKTLTPPVLRGAGLAGKPVVRFDGKGTVLGATVDPAAGVFASPPTLSIFVLVHPLGTAQQTVLVWGDPADNYPGLRLSAWKVGTAVGWDFATYDGVPATGGSNTYRRLHATGPIQAVPTLLAAVASPSALGLYRNGSSIAEQTMSNATFALHPTYVAMSIGGQVNGFNWLDGDIAELVVFDRALSAAERAQIEGYLAHKWGQASLLPDTHPFKLTPP